MQKFKILATQCAVAGSPTRSPTTSPVIHLRRRKTLRMFLSRTGSGTDRRLPCREESPDRKGNSSASGTFANNSPEKCKEVRNKLKDLFVSSPPPVEERDTGNVGDVFLRRNEVAWGGGGTCGRRGGIRPFSATFRQRLLRRAWRPVLGVIPEE